MDRVEAEQITWKILGEVEETMDLEGVAFRLTPSSKRFKVSAFFRDREYQALESAIVRILLEATKPAAVVQPQVARLHALKRSSPRHLENKSGEQNVDHLAAQR